MGTDMSNGFTFYLDAAGWVLNDAIPVMNPSLAPGFGAPGVWVWSLSGVQEHSGEECCGACHKAALCCRDRLLKAVETCEALQHQNGRPAS